MKGYRDDIEKVTEENQDFRRVLYSGKNLQLVVMTLQSGEEIGEEVHEDRDQFFRIEEGEGVIDIDGVENPVEDDIAVIVPAGVCRSCAPRMAPIRARARRQAGSTRCAERAGARGASPSRRRLRSSRTASRAAAA